MADAGWSQEIRNHYRVTPYSERRLAPAHGKAGQACVLDTGLLDHGGQIVSPDGWRLSVGVGSNGSIGARRTLCPSAVGSPRDR